MSSRAHDPAFGPPRGEALTRAAQGLLYHRGRANRGGVRYHEVPIWDFQYVIATKPGSRVRWSSRSGSSRHEADASRRTISPPPNAPRRSPSPWSCGPLSGSSHQEGGDAPGAMTGNTYDRHVHNSRRFLEGKGTTVALSDRLTELAQRAKQAEDRAHAAASEAKDDLRSDVEQASESARKTADALAQRSDAAQARASDWWGQVRSDWAEHVATVRDNLAAKKTEHDVKRSQREADDAAADADYAVDFALSAVEEAEYAVLEATLAQVEADEVASSG